MPKEREGYLARIYYTRPAHGVNARLCCQAPAVNINIPGTQSKKLKVIVFCADEIFTDFYQWVNLKRYFL